MDSLILVIGVLVGVAITRFGSRSSAAARAMSPSETRANRKVCETNEDSPAIAQSVLAGCDPYVPAGKLIWCTQIPALRTVCDYEPRGAYYEILKPIYFEQARRYPEIHDGLTFQQWGQSLLDLGVFRLERSCVHITASGRALLSELLDTSRQAARIPSSQEAL